MLSNNHVVLHTSNGWLGYPPGAPYDAIHVGAGATAIPPDLLRQLQVNNVHVYYRLSIADLP